MPLNFISNSSILPVSQCCEDREDDTCDVDLNAIVRQRTFLKLIVVIRSNLGIVAVIRTYRKILTPTCKVYYTSNNLDHYRLIHADVNIKQQYYAASRGKLFTWSVPIQQHYQRMASVAGLNPFGFWLLDEFCFVWSSSRIDYIHGVFYTRERNAAALTTSCRVVLAY